MLKEEKKKNLLSYKLISVLGFLSALIPAVIFSLWIYVFNQESNPIDRTEAFKHFFPDALHGRWDITYLAIACCIMAIILSGWIKPYCIKVWRGIHIFIIIISSILLVLFGITLL